LNAYVPLVEKWRLGLQSSGEFFFSPYEPYFERLRFASGFVWKVRNSLSIQVNYLRQLDYKINDETGKSFLQIAFGWNINPFTQQEKK
jgi:hypothetical protein